MGKSEDFEKIRSYVPLNPNEKVSKFVTTIDWQIQAIKVGIANDAVNDPKKAENFANFAERFLKSEFVKDMHRDSTIQQLKDKLKIIVGSYKELISIMKEMIDRKIKKKIMLAQNYVQYGSGKIPEFDALYEEQYVDDFVFLKTQLPTYESEILLIQKLFGMLDDKEFMQEIRFKNSWKVDTLKKAIVKWKEENELDDIPSEEISQILLLPYFRYKKYLTMTVADLKNFLRIRKRILNLVASWIRSMIAVLGKNREISQIKMKELSNDKKNLITILGKYSESIKEIEEIMKSNETLYKLCRFGQGLIENDVFSTLYK